MRKYKQSNMWNIDIRSIKAWEKKLNKQICESRNEIKQKKQKLRLWGCSLCAQEQAYMRIIKPMCTGLIMRTQVFAQKTLKAQPRLKH